MTDGEEELTNECLTKIFFIVHDLYFSEQPKVLSKIKLKCIKLVSSHGNN